MNNDYNYKVRKVCPHCLSLSIKKSKKVFHCYQCDHDFEQPIKVEMMHKNNRCIDNDVESRIRRYNTGIDRIVYEV